MPRQMFGPRKQRTRQHVIADLSVNFVERIILQMARPQKQKTLSPCRSQNLRKIPDVTYGQLEKVLRSFGFTCRPGHNNPPGHIYEHKETGATIGLPAFPETDKVFEHHLVMARGELDNFGIADPAAFAAKLHKAG